MNDMRKKVAYASKLENERINLMKNKERVLLSIIEEEKLTVKYGAKDSPLSRKVRERVEGSLKRGKL